MKLVDAIKQDKPVKYAWGLQATKKVGFFRALHTQWPGAEDMISYVHPKQEAEELVDRLTLEDGLIFHKVYKSYLKKGSISLLVNGLNL